jgi:two-component system cell cycle sensor histidine kinase/response regulator CckA
MATRNAPATGLTASLEQLQALLDSSTDLLAVLDGDGQIQSINSAFERVLGYDGEELTGKNFEVLHHPADLEKIRANFRRVVATPGAQWNCRCSLRSKKGQWRWFSVTAKNHVSDPRINAVAVSYSDITDLHRMESERQVISDIVHGLNATANLDQLLRQIHEALKKVVQAENFFVALYDPATAMFEFPFFVDEFDPPPAPQKISRSCMAYIYRTGQARLIPQAEFDRLAAAGEVELVGSPSPAWLGVPLKTPAETIGVMVVQHYRNEDAYDQRDLEFLESVGGHIALAIARRRGEEAMRKSESLFRLLFSQTPLPSWVADANTLEFLKVNEAAIRQYGYSEEEFRKLSVADIFPKDDREQCQRQLAAWNAKNGHQGHWKHRGKDGRVFEVDVISHKVDYGGREVRLVVAQDVSERKLLEDQLRQAQKMEAVGRLAGGVAHDFNNLLMVVKGHTELLLDTLPLGDHVTRKIEQIDRAADRAATLTRQLLAFSRMQVLQPRAMNLNGVVEEMGRLIPRLIGEDIELILKCDENLGTIRADASQMEQIIMNLAVNARDAMPDGGRLMIETANAELDTKYGTAHPMVQPGRYVLLAVTDTGCGMDAETQAHIFEPFFTTKEKGKGTGLGLATVYGVVKQSGGFIWVYSEAGKGSSFKIYLPRVDEAVDRPGITQSLAQVPKGTETVLLAEDEQDVREVAREFLESAGYTVLEARDGAEALRVAADHRAAIHVLVTDMVMPGMTGQDVARLMRQQSPSLGVILMSGYSEQAAGEAARKDPAAMVLTKPFSRSAILRAVREVLKKAPGN